MLTFTLLLIITFGANFYWVEYKHSLAMARVHDEWLDLAKHAERTAQDLEETSPTLNNRSGLLKFDAYQSLIGCYYADAKRYREYASNLEKHVKKVNKVQKLILEVA